jgi:hypothetical protein
MAFATTGNVFARSASLKWPDSSAVPTAIGSIIEIARRNYFIFLVRKDGR